MRLGFTWVVLSEIFRDVQFLWILTYVVRNQLALQCEISTTKTESKGTAHPWLSVITTLLLLEADGLDDDAGDGNDCDDMDPTAYPSAPEQCDDIDNDCDGVIDEDLQREWWIDEDGDAYKRPQFTPPPPAGPAGLDPRFSFGTFLGISQKFPGVSQECLRSSQRFANSVV